MANEEKEKTWALGCSIIFLHTSHQWNEIQHRKYFSILSRFWYEVFYVSLICLFSICHIVAKSYLTFFLRRGVQVSCSKKHCHSNDFSQRQCQRLSMTLPIDKSWAGLGVCNWRPDFWSDKFWLWSEEASFVCSDGFPESTSGGYKTWY